MKIIMHEKEIALFSAFLGQATSYFEFGMGGSTCLAAECVKDRIHAIDSDKAWVEKVRAEIGDTKKDLQVGTVDIGPTGNWGHPVGRDHVERFPAYSLSITRTGFVDYDFCLVDGRFRVACFLQALALIPSDSVIGFHDYASRPNYHVVEAFARPIASANELKLFVRRPGINRDALSKALERYRNNPE